MGALTDRTPQQPAATVSDGASAATGVAADASTSASSSSTDNSPPGATGSADPCSVGEPAPSFIPASATARDWEFIAAELPYLHWKPFQQQTNRTAQLQMGQMAMDPRDTMCESASAGDTNPKQLVTTLNGTAGSATR